MPSVASPFSKTAAFALMLTLFALPAGGAQARGTSLLNMRGVSPSSSALVAAPRVRVAQALQGAKGWRQPSHQLSYRDRSSRIAPMGVELTGAVLGAGLATAGAMFWGINGRCAEQGVIIGSGAPICLSEFDTRIAGIGTLTSGLLLFGGSLAMLILDARRR